MDEVEQFMREHALHQIRRYPGDRYTVETMAGKRGQGRTLSQAIELANREGLE